MPFSSGTFSLVSGNPVVTGTTISSTWANNTLNDIADNGLTICLLKDGTQTPTANIPMGGFRLTGIGNATAVSDAPRASQVQNSAFNTLSSVAGASTISGNATPTPAAYAEGQVFSFLAIGANAAGPTLNVSSLGAVPIFWAGATCTASMWSTGSRLDVVYLSTSSQTGFHLMGHSGFMPANLLRVRGSVASGVGNGTVHISAPSADDQLLVSTASASAGLAFKNFSVAFIEATVPTADDQLFVSTASAAAKGAWKNPGAAGASLVLIESTTASATAQVDFKSGFLSTFGKYVLVYESVVPQTDTANLWLRASVDGGANFLSTNEYDYAYNAFASGSGALSSAGAAAQAQAIIALNLGTGTGENMSGEVNLYGLNNAAVYKNGDIKSSGYDATPQTTNNDGTLTIKTTSAVNALRVLASTGNITSGVFSLYGLRKA